MNCYYLDSSILMRKILGQPKALKEWPEIRQAVSSRLLKVECLRTIDRLSQIRSISQNNVAEVRVRLFHLLDRVGLLPLTERVLSRAEQSFPTPLGSLDSLHLATALLWVEKKGPIVFATHDQQLALAAKAQGFEVLG